MHVQQPEPRPNICRISPRIHLPQLARIMDIACTTWKIYYHVTLQRPNQFDMDIFFFPPSKIPALKSVVSVEEYLLAAPPWARSTAN